MGGANGHVMVYRNRCLGCWSVLHQGRVVARVQSIVLEEVTFRVRAGGRLRAWQMGQRNVHAFACGRPCSWEEVPPHAVLVRYRPDGPPTFTLADGTPVVGASRVYLAPTGAFVEAPQLQEAKAAVTRQPRRSQGTALRPPQQGGA